MPEVTKAYRTYCYNCSDRQIYPRMPFEQSGYYQWCSCDKIWCRLTPLSFLSSPDSLFKPL